MKIFAQRSVNKAREHANRVKCAANLRSIGLAMTMYTQQYGYYPGCFCNRPGFTYAVWPVRLRLFTNGNQAVFYCPSQDRRCEWRKGVVSAGAVLAAEPEAALGYDLGEPLLNADKTFFSYAYNYRGTGEREGIDSQLGLGDRATPDGAIAKGLAPRPYEVRVNRVKVPSEMIAVADGGAVGNLDFAMYSTRNYAKDGSLEIGQIHGGGANILFCDGHVTWYKRLDITTTYNASVLSETPRKRLWNNDNQP